jgi:hypothetical protein
MAKGVEKIKRLKGLLSVCRRRFPKYHGGSQKLENVTISKELLLNICFAQIFSVRTGGTSIDFKVAITNKCRSYAE